MKLGVGWRFRKVCPCQYLFDDGGEGEGEEGGEEEKEGHERQEEEEQLVHFQDS